MGNFSLTDNYIAVNYHYVEDPTMALAGIHPCSPLNFERQIAFLSQHYKIVSIPVLFEAVQRQEKGKFCALAFDDGLKDQYLFAVPILKTYQASAIFFPITGAWEGILPTAHKLHVLLSHISADEIILLFNKFLEDFYSDLENNYAIPRDHRLFNKRMHESIVSANLKETFIILPEKIKRDFFDKYFYEFGLDERNLSQQIFMNQEEIISLSKSGMFIGAHSHTHIASDARESAELQKDIVLSKNILKQILGKNPTIFSYPHGRANQAVIQALKQAGFEYALTTENRPLTSADNPFLIPRYDTNDLRVIM